jgi:hypothetical protein
MAHALFGYFCNSEKYAFLWKIKIRGTKLPTAFEWAIVVVSSFFTQIFESTWPCFRSQRAISWSVYCLANTRTQSAFYVNSDLSITPSFSRVSHNKRSSETSFWFRALQRDNENPPDSAIIMVVLHYRIHMSQPKAAIILFTEWFGLLNFIVQKWRRNFLTASARIPNPHAAHLGQLGTNF